jgi:Ni,Fe-hydrogenase III component G
MAQVWLSFDEIQDLFGCDAVDARRRVVASQWAHDFFMLRYRHQPESRPAPVLASKSPQARANLGNFGAAEVGRAR